jgi:hypothetical protein
MAYALEELFVIVLENIETKEVDKSYVFLNKTEAKKMFKQIDEIVYQTFTGNTLNQWKLVELKKTLNEKIIK